MKLTTFILILMNPYLTGTQIVTNARIGFPYSSHSEYELILMGNTSKHCRMGSDSDVAGDLERNTLSRRERFWTGRCFV